VQILLNVFRGLQEKPLLSVDGVAGPLTIGAIREFQEKFTSAADGRVDPNGPTLRLLVYAYITTMRLGAYRMRKFPPTWTRLAMEERVPPVFLGDVIRTGLTDLKTGITPLLTRAKAPPRPPNPEPRPPMPSLEIDIT
jgi:peptidoglycan hydrolase-like protein with peptidoglycan-binding domain